MCIFVLLTSACANVALLVLLSRRGSHQITKKRDCSREILLTFLETLIPHRCHPNPTDLGHALQKWSYWRHLFAILTGTLWVQGLWAHLLRWGGKVEKSKGIWRSAQTPRIFSNAFLSRTSGVPSPVRTLDAIFDGASLDFRPSGPTGASRANLVLVAVKSNCLSNPWITGLSFHLQRSH